MEGPESKVLPFIHVIASLLGITRYFTCSMPRKKRAQNKERYIRSRQSIKKLLGQPHVNVCSTLHPTPSSTTEQTRLLHQPPGTYYHSPLSAPTRKSTAPTTTTDSIGHSFYLCVHYFILTLHTTFFCNNHSYTQCAEEVLECLTDDPARPPPKRPKKSTVFDLGKHLSARDELTALKRYWTQEINHHRSSPPISEQTFFKTRERLLSELHSAYYNTTCAVFTFSYLLYRNISWLCGCCAYTGGATFFPSLHQPSRHCG